MQPGNCPFGCESDGTVIYYGTIESDLIEVKELD